MATRTESVSMSDADIKEAVAEWLAKRFGPEPFNVIMSCEKSSHGEGWAEVDTETYGARASREIK